jgi:hypothetical protein
MATQLDFEKRKKETGHPDAKTEASQALLPPTQDQKQVKDLVADQVFCTLCKYYHKPNAKLRCALHRAITKIEARLVSQPHTK